MIESLSALNQNKILGYLKTDIIIYNLTNISNLIGRSPESNIVLNHPSISKEHAKINFNNDEIYIIDLNTENGTFVNKQKINPLQNINLKNNDIINFGKDTTDFILLVNYDNNETNNKIVRYPPTEISNRDNKISLVNDDNYQHSKINHLNYQNDDNFKLNSFNPFINNMASTEFNRNSDEIQEEIQINNNPIIEEPEDEITMKDSKKFISNNENNNFFGNNNPINNNISENKNSFSNNFNINNTNNNNIIF